MNKLGESLKKMQINGAFVLMYSYLFFLFTALKVKLLLRRPFDQLVAQGIMPRK